MVLTKENKLEWKGKNVAVISNPLSFYSNQSLTLNRNKVISDGSIVTKNVEPNSVVGENPAKFICFVEDYLSKQKVLIATAPNFDNSFCF